jgi:hypothetical protein
MGKIDLSPHKYVAITKGANRGRKVVDYNNPNAYIRLHDKEHGTLFIQKGKLMYPDGVAIPFEDTPDWALKQIMAQSADALREAGYNVKSVIEQVEAKNKDKNKAKLDKKKAAAAAAAKAAKKKPDRKKAEDKLPDDPEPEDVGLEEEIDEDATE